MNSINLLGRLTKDPELKTSGSGVTFCSFSLAVNRVGKKDEVDFFNCTAFNKTAEVIEQYCKKGNQLAVTGSMSSSKKDDKIYWTVNVSSISFVGNANNPQDHDTKPKQEHKTKQEPRKVEETDDDYNFPF